MYVVWTKSMYRVCCLLHLTLAVTFIDGASNRKEVIVIGAGVAGATVARQLSNDPAGRFTVTLLEGRQDRLGGRVWTETSSPGALGADADLGGSFIDATDPQSPLVQLVKDFELTLFEPGPLEIRSPDGKFERHDFTELGETVQRHLIKKIQSALVSKHSETDFSAQEALDSDTKGESLDDALWDVVLAGLIEPVFGTELSNLSASMFQLEKLSPGFAIIEGANEIVNRLISGWENSQRELPETTILVEMGKIVRQIQVDRQKKKVKVRTKDRKSLTADIVVVAVPLSTLQNGQLFFDPPLSMERQNAIKQTGVGQLNKVILRFEEVFWDNQPELFAPTADTLRSSRPLIPSWINGYRYTGAPALIGYLPGEAARRMEDMDGDTLEAEALKSLECIFGKKTMMSQKLVSIQRSSWSGDPLAGGSASFYAVGNTADMRKDLFRPVCPYLYFAGEYATLDKPGTIEGAYLSGLDVADQIMNGCRSGEKRRKKSAREEL